MQISRVSLHNVLQHVAPEGVPHQIGALLTHGALPQRGRAQASVQRQPSPLGDRQDSADAASSVGHSSPMQDSTGCTKQSTRRLRSYTDESIGADELNADMRLTSAGESSLARLLDGPAAANRAAFGPAQAVRACAVRATRESRARRAARPLRVCCVVGRPQRKRCACD